MYIIDVKSDLIHFYITGTRCWTVDSQVFGSELDPIAALVRRRLGFVGLPSYSQTGS